MDKLDIEIEQQQETSDTDTCLNTWADNGFIKPLCAVQELSGFDTLTWLYNILVTLAVTSSSVERAMSRVKIIFKNQLRSTRTSTSTMLDDWFSSMILASEKDILEKISASNIIDNCC